MLERTVRKQRARVRIVAELINAADGIALCTQTFDRELKDIFAVQEEIAKAVARGEKEKAFEWLQISFDHRDSGTLALLVDPLLNGLRDDPRYKGLIAKMNFPTT